MKNKLLVALTILLALVLSVPVLGAEGSYSWYIKRAKEHLTPTIEDCTQNLLKKYDGWYVNEVCSGLNSEKVIYLTFDVGYENGNVAKTLDILKEENVQGAFFVLSHVIKSSPNLLKRMKEEGHLVCNHTATHKNPCSLTEDALRKEIRTLEDLYTEKTGERLSPYFRPPEGKYDEKTLKTVQSMGYKTIFWSLAYADWDDSQAPSDEKAKEILKNNTHNGAVVLIHPTSNVNARILRDMIEYWRGEGYRFGSLEELKTQNA